MVDIAVGRQPGTIAVGIRHRCRQRDAAETGRQRLQPRKRQRQQVAALGGGEGVDLVDHDRLEPREHQFRLSG
jgi:hypothetical protein